ncbi:MAG: aldo/keto reductase [Eubacteriales bacterium]|nr:aldo/keto reductase [Eubacteriales bacterium]
MDKIRLGRTELMATACSFGALPIQRIPAADAAKLLRRAYDSGINFFDTANAYSDSEEKIGLGLHNVRQNIILATKSAATDKATVMQHIELSLKRMQTDYIDLFQFHNPAVLPDPANENGAYAAALEAKKKGMIRFIGITNHRLALSRQAVETGWYDTLQFPFSCLASADEIALAAYAHQHDMGFIAMKGMSGGLIKDAALTFTFMKQHPFVVPIWGMQRESELEQFLSLEQNPPAYDADMQARIEQEKAALSGNFCRSCGYCLPCPAHIDIPNAARMMFLLRRSPSAQWLQGKPYESMMNINNCIHCDHCKNHCPYGLDTPALLQENLKDYIAFKKEFEENK